MRYLLAILLLSSTYFVEWIPNNATAPAPAAPAPPPPPHSPGEFPWQL